MFSVVDVIYVNEGLIHVTAWMDIENSPSDRSQTEKATQIRTILLKSVKVTQIRESLGSSSRKRKLDQNGERHLRQSGRW